MLVSTGFKNLKQDMPVSPVQATGTPMPWAHRFTLLAMFVYVAKIADVFPPLGGWGLGKILIGLAVAALLMEGVRWRKGLLQDPLFRPYLWTMGLILLSVPFAVWPGNSFNFVFGAFAKDVALVLLLILTTRTQHDIQRVMLAFVANALVLDYALFQYGPTGITAVSVGRNEAAMVSVMALGLLLPLPVHGLGKLFKAAAAVTLAAAVLVSNSRGGMLGLAFVVAVFLYFSLGKKIGITAMLVVGICYIVYLQLPTDVRTNVESIINYEQDYNVTAPEGRMEIWKRGLRIVYDNPLLGVGINNFAVAEGQMDVETIRPWMTAHNSPLQVAAEIGIPGLIVYFVLISRIFGAAQQLRRRWADSGMGKIATALFVALAGYMVTGFFLSQGFSVVLYILMAITLVAVHIGQTSQPRPASRPRGGK